MELSGSRHSVALELLAASNLATSSLGKAASGSKGKRKASLHTAAEAGPKPGHPPPVLFVCADCAAPHLWIEDGPLACATVVFTCSILFDDQLMSRLAQRIESCPTIRAVATLRRFPRAPRGFAEAAPAEACETSWMVAKHACPLLSGTGPCTAGTGAGREASQEALDIKGLSGGGSHVYIYLRTSAVIENLHVAGLALVRTTGGATQWQFGT